jgi:hypothetical protein
MCNKTQQMFHVSKQTLYVTIKLEMRCLLLDYKDCEEILLSERHTMLDDIV